MAKQRNADQGVEGAVRIPATSHRRLKLALLHTAPGVEIKEQVAKLCDQWSIPVLKKAGVPVPE